MAHSSRPVLQGESKDDVTSLAVEAASAYRRMAAFYHHQLEMTLPEADGRARGIDFTPEEVAADIARIRDRPPDQVSWFDFTRLLEREPETFEAVWDQMKHQARQEFSSGHRTAQALEWQRRPWDRARFLAIRDSFRADYEPRPGMESALVDIAAESFADYLALSEHLHMLEGTEVESTRRRAERDGDWAPMRLSYAEAIAQAATRAERAHQRFLRTVAMLGSLRRSGPIQVGQGGQVNIAQQQVVITRLTAEVGG